MPGMSKGLLSESHPLYLGMYNGESSQGDVGKIVEGADLVLDVGGVAYCDGDTDAFSAHLDSSKVVTVWPDHVEIGFVDLRIKAAHVDEARSGSLKAREPARMELNPGHRALFEQHTGEVRVAHDAVEEPGAPEIAPSELSVFNPAPAELHVRRLGPREVARHDDIGHLGLIVEPDCFV